MLIAAFGHLLCGWCDCLRIYAGGERSSFRLTSEDEKMKRAFAKMPVGNPLLAMDAPQITSEK